MWMLIVDDEAFAREAVIESVDWRQYDLTVKGVSSAEEALAFMEEQNVDILMTDVKMPHKGGLELIEEVRAKGMDPGIIVLSSFNEFDLVRGAMRLGVEDYLFKPSMMPKDILDAVLKVKSRRTKKRDATAGTGGQEVQKREMQKALAYIRTHLGEKDLSLTMVADHIGMSKNYFSKIFKESMGENFVNYVTRLRMEYARELYLGSDRKIYEIAEMVGYSDWHYFYNLYRKTFGHSLSYEKRAACPAHPDKKLKKDGKRNENMYL